MDQNNENNGSALISKMIKDKRLEAEFLLYAFGRMAEGFTTGATLTAEERASAMSGLCEKIIKLADDFYLYGRNDLAEKMLQTSKRDANNHEDITALLDQNIKILQSIYKPEF